ncbi:glycosyltransferase family 4 protein [Conexibacter sp. CPCC 206217]|uniref:glycosyltransferase family 4 protein n=1 Tax=Conexibacter sp. CPCC 206217 TaxID=3064574 RepID=UPI0027231444|nr:glycosyltransferase family 4 protein [Conexibacter sp. CPCC 206217]MDO8211355.1 glycosyltransferase family 4 protein [Conexibacter sp. CPCC 206217]
MSSSVRVQLVDPSAFTPPYDHALAAALARAGADVELVTSRFAYGTVPRGDGYVVNEAFYRIAPGAAGSRSRMLAKLAQHVPDMLRYARHARAADVVHFQWLSVQPVDVHLLPLLRRGAGRHGGGRPLVLTAHDVLPREPRPGQLDAQRRLYERVDAVVVHSEHGAARLRDELRVDPAKVHVIPHGAFTHFVPGPPPAAAPAAGAASGAEPAVASTTRESVAAPARPLPPELAAVPRERPVVLMFGLLRPYKGLDVLLEAWRGIEDAELWVVGLPKLDLAPLRAVAPPNVRFVSRFVADDEIAAFFQRADLVVLPYREIDQSGVLFTALGFGTPLLLSAVGGFPEVAATGAAELVPPGDPAALHTALVRLLADPAARARLAAAARTAAAGQYSWDAIGQQTLSVYRSLLSR